MVCPLLVLIHVVFTLGSAQEETDSAPQADDEQDLAWEEHPQSWHQQAIRIVDHPFSTLQELHAFGLAAKKAGVSVVELVGPQKTARCVGYWCGGLGLCDHINGSFPASDGTLEEWQQMLAEIKPVRLMWWGNFVYWSTQGEILVDTGRGMGTGQSGLELQCRQVLFVWQQLDASVPWQVDRQLVRSKLPFLWIPQYLLQR